MKIKNVTQVEPTLSRCITVSGEDKLFASGGTNGKSFITHNSVIQRNIINACIMRPDKWRFIGIDLKKVELSRFRKYSDVVLGVATTVEDAAICLRFAAETMMKRYAELEEVGKENFLDLPDSGHALLVMGDELGELLSDSPGKALVESTVIPNDNGRKNLGEIEVGDTIYDNLGKPTTVIHKYEPGPQDKYDMTISCDSTGETQDFVAGSEHLWVARFFAPDGRLLSTDVVDTEFLFDFKREQDKKPESERVTVKFRKG